MLGEQEKDTGRLFNRIDLRYDQNQIGEEAKPLCKSEIKGKTFVCVCVYVSVYMCVHASRALSHT